MDCHIIQSTRFTITGLCLAMSLQGCLSNDLSSKANSAPLRQVHPQVHTYDHALAEMGKQVPGFGGMYVDASGNLIVYLKQGQLEKAVAIPDVAQAALRSALEKVFGADTSRHVSVPHNGKPVTTNPQIQFIAGNYSITELNGWYPDVQLALDIPEVLFTDIDEAKNRITIGIQNESARQAVHTALANSGIPARALNIEVLAPTTSQANLRQTIRPSHGGMRISVFHEDLNPGAFPMYCSIGFNATHSQWGNGFVTNAHCGKTMGVVDPYEVHQYAIDGGRVTDQSFIGWELVDPTFWRSPYPWVCPAFSRCRYSDAVFVGNYGFEPTTLGKLARPALKNHVSHLDVFIEVGNSEAIVKAVEAGFGVSFVSRLAAEWALALGSVVEVPVANFDLHREIFLIRPEIQKANRAIDAYWGFVHDPANNDLLRLAEE